MRALFQKYRHPLLALALISVTHLLFVLLKWHQVPLHDGLSVGSTDPDPWMRLGLVRDWLSGGSWYDHVVHRSNAPFGGIASPWTRPLDVVIALLVKLQPSDIDLNLRLMRAALLLPWIWMSLLLIGMYRLVRQLSPVPAVYLMASVLVAAMPVTWNYFGLGNADHHAPLAVLFIWALGLILTPEQTPRGTILAGLLLALMLWISFEALILIGIIYAWYGIGWLRGQHSGRTLAVLATRVAVFVAAALMIERPMGDWVEPIYDSISIVYAVLLILAAALAWFLDRAPARHTAGRFLLAAIGSAALLLAFHNFYPLAFKGPLVMATPFAVHEFLPRITEVQPLYHADPLAALALLIQPLTALTLCVLPWRTPARTFYTRERAASLLFFLGATLLLFVGQQRWSYYLYPLTACIIAPFLASLFTPEHPSQQGKWPANTIAHLSPNGQAARRLPVLLLLLILPLGLALMNGYAEERWGNQEEQTLNKQRESCYRAARQLIYGGQLSALGNGKPLTILAPTDLGSEILFFTPHRILASNYHREGDAIEYAWGADKITDANALRSYLKKRKVDVVLACPTITAPKDGVLHDAVFTRHAPSWMKAITYALPPSHATKEDSKNTVDPALYLVQ